MNDNLRNAISRRTFVMAGSLASASGLIAVGTRFLSPALADDSDKQISQQLADLFSGPDAAALRQFIANALTDPALPALAASTLQTNFASLSGFQKSFLTAIGSLTSDLSTLRALALGSTLTPQQKQSKQHLRDAALDNPAMLKLLYTAKKFRGSANATLLSNYVTQAIANLSMTLRPPTPLGSPALDALANDIARIRLSTAYARLAPGLVAIMQSPAFIPFLKHQRESVIASIIPPNVVLGLLLPVDMDPGLSDTTRGIIEVLMAVGGMILAFVTLPEDLLVGATGLGIIALIYLLEAGGLILGFDDIFKGIDCDFDGDPSDPNDVPGIECP